MIGCKFYEASTLRVMDQGQGLLRVQLVYDHDPKAAARNDAAARRLRGDFAMWVVYDVGGVR